jgi:hypothetical protein
MRSFGLRNGAMHGDEKRSGTGAERGVWYAYACRAACVDDESLRELI